MIRQLFQERSRPHPGTDDWLTVDSTAGGTHFAGDLSQRRSGIDQAGLRTALAAKEKD